MRGTASATIQGVTDEQQHEFKILVGPLVPIDELMAQLEAEEEEQRSIRSEGLEFVSPSVPGRQVVHRSLLPPVEEDG
jgi:hypothetical protein